MNAFSAEDRLSPGAGSPRPPDSDEARDRKFPSADSSAIPAQPSGSERTENSGPQTSEPQTSEPQTSEPQTSEPQTSATEVRRTETASGAGQSIDDNTSVDKPEHHRAGHHSAGGILWAARLSYLILFAILLFYIIGPLIGHSWTPPISQKDDGFIELVLAEELQMRALHVFTVMWILTLGTSVGSFLNVVVYRSPRGKTLLGSSQCPRCQHRIRARHNLPVIGWLQLEGRCYDCRLPIAGRYPLIEALVGGIFLSLAVVELFLGGVNLPLRPREIYSGITWILFFPRWDLISIFLFHTGMLCVLLSWALVQWDRMRIPPLYRLTSFVVVLGLGWNFPHLYPVLWNVDPELYFRFRPTPPLSGLSTAILGALAGSVAGWVLAASAEFGCARPHDLGPRRETLREVESGFCLVGLVMGWQVIGSLALLTSLALVLARRGGLVARSENAWLLLLFLTTWLYLLVWRLVAELPWWPGPLTGWPYHLGLLLLACGLARWGQPRRFTR